MRMSAEYALGIVPPPDESMPPDSPIYRSLRILRFYSASGGAASAGANCQMCFQGVRGGGGSGQASGGSAGPRGAAARFLFSQLRRSSRLWQRRPANPFLRSGVRSVFLFPRRVRALGFQRLLAEQPSQHGPSGTAPCDQLVRGNAMSASHQATVVPVSGRFGGYFNNIDASACGHCPPWRRRQSDQQTIAVYRGAASEHSPSARFASSARPGDRFKVRARSSALLHSAYCLSWRCTSP